MKTKTFFCFLLCIFIVFNSCKESEDAIKNTSPSPRLKKVTYYSGDLITSQESYTYDNDWRLIKLTSSEGYYYSYTYASGRIIARRYFTNGDEASNDTLLLNEMGFEISRARGIRTREYNPESMLVKEMFKSHHPISYIYKNENGNTVQMTKMDGDSCENIREVQTMEYLSNSTNTIGPENMGITFGGKQDKNLISVLNYMSYGPVYTSESNIIYISFTRKYEYEYDVQNRVTKRKIIGSIPNIYSSYTYYD